MMTTETIARFWAKVKKTGGCWLWVASKRHKGYGAFGWTDEKGRTTQDRAHRFSWEIHNGPIPDGLCVLHNCPDGDNPACVNPDHLWLGTKKDNNADMLIKCRKVSGGTHCGVNGKYKKGEVHHAAKLTADIVREIRRDHASSGATYAELGAKYAIHQSAAWKVVNRARWKHVT